MIEKMVGERLVRDVAVDLVAENLKDLIRRENLVPLRLPIDIEGGLEIGQDREARFDARIEVLPMVDKIAFDGLTLEPRREVTAGAVRERLTLIAARKAPLETTLVGRAAGEYDQVVLEGTATFKDDEGGPREIKDLRVDLAPWSEPPPALVEKLKGRVVGDTGVAELVLPDTAGGGRPRYASLSFKVKEIVARRIPEIDEELAKDFDMESLAELEQTVRDTLEKEAFDEYVAHNGERILEQLSERVAFDLPPSYSTLVGDPPSAPEGGQDSEEEKKAREQRQSIAQLYDRLSRRNLLTMLVAYQNGLKLPEETMQRASDQMRRLIDEREGTRRDKDLAFEQWRREFEEGVFARVLFSFLVQEVEKAAGKNAEPGTDAPSQAAAGAATEAQPQGIEEKT